MAPHGRGRRGYRHSCRHDEGRKTLHFSSVLNPETILLGKLVIPGSFVAKCGRSLSTPVLLKVDQKIWQVRLREHGGMLWMCTGLSKIFKKYFLEEGYTLLFGYKGNSLFYVSILDSTGMGIDPSSRLRARSRSPSPDSEDTEMDIENSSEEETSDDPTESSADEEEADIKIKKQKNRATSSSSKTDTGASGDGTSRVSGEAEEADDQFEAEQDDPYQMESSDSEVNKFGGFKQPSMAKDTAAGPPGTAGKGEWEVGGFKQPSTTKKDTATGPSGTAGKGDWDPYGTP